MRRAAGFTLTEILVALALAGLLVGGLSSAVAAAARHHAELEQRALLQERAAHVLAVLEPELQLAGYGGLASLESLPWPASLPAAALACGTLALRALRIDEDRYRLPCEAHGGGAMPASDVVTVLRASARAAAPTAGRVQVLSSRRAGDRQGILADGAAVTGAPRKEGLLELHDLERLTFYVARSADGAAGEPALRMKELTALGGEATMRDSELLAGVESLCIERPRPKALRVTVRVRSDHVVGPPREQAFACRGRGVTVTDAYLRTEVSRSFAIRNAEASGAE